LGKIAHVRRIAADVERALERRARLGAPGRVVGKRLGAGPGWSVEDVVCTWGPGDRPFEEGHRGVSVSLVLSGTFQYRTGKRPETLVPGSVLLGNESQSFECGHDHAAGDRCVAFRYSEATFEEIVAELGARPSRTPFRISRLPPLRDLSRVVTAATCGVLGLADVSWEELALEAAAEALRLSAGTSSAAARPSRGHVAHVTEAVRGIESDPAAPHTLGKLAADAGLTPFHYLRTFKRVTGVTPHQFILRTRLRAAAARIVGEAARVIDVAFDAGFGDLSNFNRSFRAELGVTPTAYRARAQSPGD
jgi:AraC-like DNA-binding protein